MVTRAAGATGRQTSRGKADATTRRRRDSVRGDHGGCATDGDGGCPTAAAAFSSDAPTCAGGGFLFKNGSIS